MPKRQILLVALCIASAGPAIATPTTAPRIVAAANAFLATLDEGKKSAVLFERDDTAQKQRWSNLPAGAFKRAGLTWAELDEAQRAAWLEVMQITLSAEGYRRVVDEWRADDALARSAGGGANRPQFGMGFYYIALIGAPSDKEPWQWQWGGHHVTINATIVGPHVVLTPSFIGVQPSMYTDANGNTVRPLGDIEREAFALVNWLDADQQRAAILGNGPIDVQLGPGEDGKKIAPEGLPAARMTADQQAGLMKLIGHYTGLANDEDAAERTAEVRAALDQTYFAWYGPTTPGSAIYFRVTGPTLVIEYAPQGAAPGGGGRGTSHIHGIYRDPTNDYAERYLR